jgi:PadR family transcriptional regulator PadR
MHMADVRVTIAVARVLLEFLADVGESRYGYELMQLTGFPSGKLYPILARLQRIGWLSREREVIDPIQSGRPARYMYRITPDGIEAAQAELSALREQLSPPVRALPRLRIEGGYA